MVREVLKIKTDNGLGADNPTFHDIEITDYSFKSPRMGMPELTATLMWSTCLDDEWTHKEYVELRGEKYYIRQTASSEKSNSDTRYKHSLEFKSERDQLSHVYFYDVVPSWAFTSDRPNTNSTKFTFFGTPKEYCDRLNCAFRYAGIGDSILNTKTDLTDADVPVGDGYCVVLSALGDGDLNQSQEFSWEDQWLWDALTEGYNKFEIPFAFHGKKIVFNEYVEPINHVFKYGFDNSCLSVKKNNSNAKIINRITFKGSSENIPYYYPNESEYGHVYVVANSNNKTLTTEDFTIVNPNKLISAVSQTSSVIVTSDKTIPLNYGYLQRYYASGGWKNVNTYSWDIVEGNDVSYAKVPVKYKLPITMETGGSAYIDAIFGKVWDKNTAMQQSPTGGVSFVDADNLIPSPDFKILNLIQVSNIIDGKSDFSVHVSKENGRLFFKDMQAGDYYLEFEISWRIKGKGYCALAIRKNYESSVNYHWELDGRALKNLSEIGMSMSRALSADMAGDGFRWYANGRMAFQTNLMPPKYRETSGYERFYNALNNTYVKSKDEYYFFKNPYVEGNPNEYIYVDESVKPTIEGIENSQSQLFGAIADIAFDSDDNDSLKGAATENGEKNDAANYAHSFFYIKLNKFDGEYGFDLFKSASQTDPMTIQMTSGSCNGCKFKIQVVESTGQKAGYWENPVQTVGPDGNIVGGTQNDKIDKNNIQNFQQDTTQNSIWIAVQKDAETFGVIMPNRSHEYLPEIGDTFNIINIDLPQGYITAAEKRGEKAMLDFMENNNEEKFDFDITASRIFFAEHPEILAELNESSRIKIQYNGVTYLQYVNSLETECKDNEPLPNVKIELADSLTPGGNFVEEIVAQAAAFGGNKNNSIILGSAGGGLPVQVSDARYMSKVADDRSPFRIASDKAFEVGNFVSGSTGGIFFNDKQTGQSHIEVDNIHVRKKAVFEILEIAHIRNIGGKQLITPGGGMTISFVDELDEVYRCYFKQSDNNDSAECRFIVGDDVICQSFNAAKASTGAVSNKFYWRRVVSVSDSGAYVDLSKTTCASNSDKPSAGDEICHLGGLDFSRQSAIVLSTVDAFSPNITLYQGVTEFNLDNREMVDIGVDKTTNRAYLHVYGDAFIGDRQGSSYIKYNNITKKLEVKAKISVESTIGDMSIDDYINSHSPAMDGYEYLRIALADRTTIDGGLLLTSMIRLGKDNSDPTSQTVWAGHSGVYTSGRSIASWWGGDMVDLFYDNDTRKYPTPDRGASALVRMDGSAYFSKGNVGFRKDGSGWLGKDNGGIEFTTDGAMIFGSGIKIDVNNETKGLQATLESFANFVSGLTWFLKPCDKDKNPISWQEAMKSDGNNGYKAKSIKSTIGLWSESFLSGRGYNDDQSSSGGGTSASYLEDLLDVSIKSPSAGDVLKYDAISGKWVNGTSSGGGIDESELDEYLRNNNYVQKADLDALKLTIQNGTVAYASRLANARTLWGQSFNGSADVSGTISSTGAILPSSKAGNYSIGNPVLPYYDVYARKLANTREEDDMEMHQAVANKNLHLALNNVKRLSLFPDGQITANGYLNVGYTGKWGVTPSVYLRVNAFSSTENSALFDGRIALGKEDLSAYIKYDPDNDMFFFSKGIYTAGNISALNSSSGLTDLTVKNMTATESLVIYSNAKSSQLKITTNSLYHIFQPIKEGITLQFGGNTKYSNINTGGSPLMVGGLLTALAGMKLGSVASGVTLTHDSDSRIKVTTSSGTVKYINFSNS